MPETQKSPVPTTPPTSVASTVPSVPRPKPKPVPAKPANAKPAARPTPDELKAVFAKPTTPLIEPPDMKAVGQAVLPVKDFKPETKADRQAHTDAIGRVFIDGMMGQVEPPVVAVAVIAVGQVIEWTRGRFAGCLGHVLAIERDGVLCVQQPCDLPAPRWFKVPNGEFKIIGKAAGHYKIADQEIARQTARLSPKAKKAEQWDAQQ